MEAAPQPPPPAADPDPVGLGIRFGALLLDTVVLFALFLVMAALFGDTESNDDGAFASLTGGPFVIYLGLVFSYFIGLESRSGQTLGKRAARIRVGSADGGALTVKAATIRNLLRLIDMLPFLYLVGAILIIATKRNQRVGDLVADTVVVRA